MLSKSIVKFICIILVYVCILLPCFSDDEADRWFWPLGDESGEILLRPGYVENPVYGNTISNHNYYINGEYGVDVYVPEGGMVSFISLFSLPYPDAVISWSWGSLSDFRETQQKKKDPVMIESNLTTLMGIKLDNGKTIWIEGLENIVVAKGDRIERGQILGSLGYIRTFSEKPCLRISLSTSSGKVDESLGMVLAGEDNSGFYSTIKKMDFTYKPDKKLTKEQTLEAWDIFSQAIAEDHPALLDAGIKQKTIEQLHLARLTIENDITVHELRLLMRQTLSYLHCVHTKIRPIDTRYYADFLPLDLYIQDDVCYVCWDRREKKEIPAGSVIETINDKSISEWMNILLPFAGSDSINSDVRKAEIGSNFSTYLEGYLPVNDAIQLTGYYFGGEKFSFTLSRIPVQKLGSYSWPEWMYEQKETFKILNADTAVMRISTISQLLDKECYAGYFQTLAEQNIRNLIIDLRGNPGGENELTGAFLAYFTDEEFKCDESTEIRHAGPYDSFKYSVSMPYNESDPYPDVFIGYQTPQNGKYVQFSTDVQQNASQYRFSGQVYVLVDSACASASVLVARRLSEQGAIVIGMETSGGFYSCNAQKYNTIVLGESDLQLRMPLFRVTFAGEKHDDIPPNRGLIPQYQVSASLEDKLYGTDSVLDFTLDLIANPPAEKAVVSSDNNRGLLILSVFFLVMILTTMLVLIRKKCKSNECSKC